MLTDTKCPKCSNSQSNSIISAYTKKGKLTTYQCLSCKHIFGMCNNEVVNSHNRFVLHTKKYL